jgi:hypothetical protein
LLEPAVCAKAAKALSDIGSYAGATRQFPSKKPAQRLEKAHNESTKYFIWPNFKKNFMGSML